MIPPLAPIVPTKKRNFHPRSPSQAERETLTRMMQGQGHADRSVMVLKKGKGYYPSGSGAAGRVAVDVALKKVLGSP